LFDNIVVIKMLLLYRCELLTGFYFQPFFASCVKSKYRESISSSMHQSQKSVLHGTEMRSEGFCEPHDYEQRILPANPCHLDNVYFGGIEMLG
jgi:hypothetical protein